MPLQRPVKRAEIAEREAFLRLLSRDFPDSVFCELCNVIHGGDKSFKIRGGVLTPCFKHDSHLEMCTSIHEGFRFITFQMVMKRHALGLDTTSYMDQLCFKNIRHFRKINHFRNNFPTEIISEARIVNGSLLLRWQQVILYPDRNESFDGTVPICQHMIWYPNGSRDFQVNIPLETDISTFSAFSDSKRSGRQERFSNNKSVMRRAMKHCTRCHTEYRVDIQAWGQHSGVIIITRWMDLGTGESVFDHKWWSHFSRTFVERANGEFVHLSRPTQLSSGLGDICRSFEQKDPGQFDPTLRPERISELAKLVDLSCRSMQDYKLVKRKGYNYLHKVMRL
jgi:hypothetical protein